METAQISVLINADAEQVWKALREPKLISQWHGWEVVSLDDEIAMIYFSDSKEAADHLRLDLGEDHTFTLVPGAEGTTLNLEVRRGNGPMAPYFNEMVEGWTSFLHQLKFMLEHHPRTPRRTYYADGLAKNTTKLWAAAGIDTGWLPDAGESYELSLTNGVALAGNVWFRSENQIGLTVSNYADHGDGLLILAQQEPSPGIREKAGAQLIISTYGLGAAAYEQIATDWDTFMEENFPSPEAAD